MNEDTDKTAREQEILEFPCEFPLKIMGRDETAFREAAITIVETHAGPLAEGAVRTRSSRDGNFIALTVTIVATSRAQLDALYTDLSAHEDILMVL